MRRDEDLLADGGDEHAAIDLHLDLALDEHDDLVGRVREVLPPLPGRIGPEIVREATRPPGARDGGAINSHSPAA